MLPSRDWSCAGDAVAWHGYRETIRYAIYDELAPLRTSVERLHNLVSLWVGTPDGVEHPERLYPGHPCPVGEAFLMLLNFVMSSYPRIKNGEAMDVSTMNRVLDHMEDSLPLGAVFQSTWPIFGLYALVQHGLLGIGGVKEVPAYVDMSLVRMARICRSGETFVAAINQWLEDSASSVLSSTVSVMEAAKRFGKILRYSPGECLDNAARPMLRVIIAFLRNGSNLTRGDVSGSYLYDAVESSVRGLGWRKLFFTGWPVFAVLHRLQEAIFRDAFCADADEGSYGILSRAAPQSVWICAKRDHDVVDERWRQQGTFDDCTQILQAMRLLPRSSDGLFLDVGANLGFCTLMLTSVGLIQKAIAFEPVPSVARRLQAAVLRNRLRDAVTVVEAAAGRVDATGSLHCVHGHGATCYVVSSSNLEDRAAFPLVRSISLDNFLDHNKDAQKLFAVKIDVEGSEEEALLGAARHLSSMKPFIFIELHPFGMRERGSSSERVIDLLVQFGYFRFEAVSMESSPYCRDEASLVAQGVYLGARWRSADILLAIANIPGPCSCSLACLANLIRRQTRCWEFYQSSRTCVLKRNCGNAPITAADSQDGAPIQWISEDLELDDDSWAGEMNGNMLVSTLSD